MKKTVTRTYTVIECDKCGKIIPAEKEFSEAYTCYACGKDVCKECRTNYENTQNKNEVITLCKECEQNIYNIFQKEETNDTTP